MVQNDSFVRMKKKTSNNNRQMLENFKMGLDEVRKDNQTLK